MNLLSPLTHCFDLGRFRKHEGNGKRLVTQAGSEVESKMAAAVQAELRFRDGLREKVSVTVENNLSSLIGGIRELNTNVSLLLSQLVEREKTRGACAEG